MLYTNLHNLQDSERKLKLLAAEFKLVNQLTDNKMVVATPVSNSDSLSEETLVGDDQNGHEGIMINSNSLESVPSLCSEVIT